MQGSKSRTLSCLQISMGLIACLMLIFHATLNAANNVNAKPPEYGDRVAMLDPFLARKLAQAHQPNQSGAMGRNKTGYIHPRFQLGLHHLVDYGLVSERVDVLERFFQAAEYAMAQQLPSGDFHLQVPESMAKAGTPSAGDRASGVAFFVASIGLGLVALETNTRFQNTDASKGLRRRAARIKAQLEPTRTYLQDSKALLIAADQHAPNRLLFNALALHTLDRLLDNKDSIESSRDYVELALKQVDATEGYFIEGGGYDSSYNAVAAALALRLVLLDYPSPDLKETTARAMAWQHTRIADSGEVRTAGNARVRPGEGGESFMGREKDVDVLHLVEALMTASLVLDDPEMRSTALRVIDYYESRLDRRRH